MGGGGSAGTGGEALTELIADLFGEAVADVGVCPVNQFLGHVVGYGGFGEVELDHMAFVPVPGLADVGVVVDHGVEFVGIPFQLDHVAEHEGKAAENFVADAKHDVFRAEGHIFGGVWL